MNTINCIIFFVVSMAVFGLSSAQTCSSKSIGLNQACGSDHTKSCQWGLYCINSVCIAPNNGAACTSDSDCTSTLGCNPANKCGPLTEIGYSCSTNAQCVTGFCDSGFCAHPANVYAGSTCTVTAAAPNPCPADYYCSGSTSRCVSKPTSGNITAKIIASSFATEYQQTFYPATGSLVVQSLGIVSAGVYKFSVAPMFSIARGGACSSDMNCQTGLACTAGICSNPPSSCDDSVSCGIGNMCSCSSSTSGTCKILTSECADTINWATSCYTEYTPDQTTRLCEAPEEAFHCCADNAGVPNSLWYKGAACQNSASGLSISFVLAVAIAVALAVFANL